MGHIPKEKRICIDCGKLGVQERRRCKDCAKEFNRLRAKKRHEIFGRSFIIGECEWCRKELKKYRKEQKYHSQCFNEARLNSGNDYYDATPRDKRGMTVGRRFVLDLGIQIPKGYVVHHVDMNPKNNVPINLWLMTRSSHAKLHRHLERHWSSFLKENDSNFVNCWDTLRDHLTTAWLETASVKVIKISDIGQSAAKPLSSKEYEEGSETT